LKSIIANFGGRGLKIGTIVRGKCLEVLGVEPNITIDFETRLSFSISATAAQLDTVLEGLPEEVKQTWMVLARSIEDNLSIVEMKPRQPSSRDLAAEIDEIKARVDEIERRITILT
jgi:hypothetical protein